MNRKSLSRIHPGWLIFMAIFIFSGVLEPDFQQKKEETRMQINSTYLIDDFTNEKGMSTTGNQWRMFTDRVMGGRSTATWRYDRIDDHRCLRLQGSVSLENRGGFIQVALPLKRNGRLFNAEDFRGVRLTVRGNGESYHVHLRTSQTILPWQYYWAAFTTGPGWQTIDIPFDQFRPESLKKVLNPRKLKRIAIVAINKAFEADVAVSRLEFYR